ncbi:FMN-binding protein [Streptococcus sobrinus]|uniref:FMN-binding protein n=1 Tax=Streptococcus sobrinus TaxID=1310 RepID=UPI0002C02803|nr:FMN-binding protein [Streptococcus sobrinus]EMP72622.1 NADH oxidase family protein [Streptococcus sobrinus DSM 20742 = ATCC 33478]SQG13996.1 putative NADH-dependent flavin oxidoreductase [Streptococcus sobrinus]
MTVLKSGVYDVIAEGYEGHTTAYQVTIEGDKIAAIHPQKEIVPDSLEDTVIKRLTSQIIGEQTLNVDAISGASHTSRGLVKAIGDVIEEAGGKRQDFLLVEPNNEERMSSTVPAAPLFESDDEYSNWRTAPDKVDEEMVTDFLIIGAGISGLAAAVQAGELGNFRNQYSDAKGSWYSCQEGRNYCA